MAKRAFDIVLSFIGTVACIPLFTAAALLIKIEDGGPVFFGQERIGRNFVPFRIMKFRTMTGGGGPLVTVGGDRRVTRIGRFLRKTKLDELPQLINVLKGEMSFVGPRPEVEKYVALFRSDYERLLRVRPGITDPASIEFSDEEAVLARSEDWEREYIDRVLPEKIRISLGYLQRRNILTDMRLIIRTVFGI